jgi:hypothetical protein
MSSCGVAHQVGETILVVEDDAEVRRQCAVWRRRLPWRRPNTRGGVDVARRLAEIRRTAGAHLGYPGADVAQRDC